MSDTKKVSSNKQARIDAVKGITKQLEGAASIVLIDFAGMDVKTQQELKERLREVDSQMVVVKNTLLKIAGKSAKVPDEILTDTVLTGQTALIITQEDPLSPIQVLGNFVKEFNLPQLKVGIVEGSFQDKDNLIKLSKLPGKEQLLAQVVAGIASPIYGIISVLNSKTQELIYVLENAKGGE